MVGWQQCSAQDRTRKRTAQWCGLTNWELELECLHGKIQEVTRARTQITYYLGPSLLTSYNWIVVLLMIVIRIGNNRLSLDVVRTECFLTMSSLLASCKCGNSSAISRSRFYYIHFVAQSNHNGSIFWKTNIVNQASVKRRSEDKWSGVTGLYCFLLLAWLGLAIWQDKFYKSSSWQAGGSRPWCWPACYLGATTVLASRFSF